MSKANISLASFEVRVVIRIFRELCLGYEPSVISEGKVRQLWRSCKNERTMCITKSDGAGSLFRPTRSINKWTENCKNDQQFTWVSRLMNFCLLGVPLPTQLSQKSTVITNCVQGANWECSSASTKSKECAVNENVWTDSYHQDGDDSLVYVITDDKKYISNTNADSKQKSMQWHYSNSPKSKMFNESPYSNKIMMGALYWDGEGMALVDFVKRGLTADV